MNLTAFTAPAFEFPWLAEASLRISVVLVFFLVARPLLRRAISSAWLSAIWLVVLARLLAPWPIESHWSLFPGGRELPSFAAVKASAWQASARVLDGTDSESARAEQHRVLAPQPAKPAFWRHLWMAGACLGGMLLAMRTWQTWRLSSLAMPASHPRLCAVFQSIPAELRRGVELRETDAVSMPTLAGIFRRQIWMPRSWIGRLSDADLRHVLLHELGHASRHDLLVQWFFSAAVCIHWFNPLVWLAARCAQADREMACDAWVLDRAKDAAADAYGATLLSCIALLRQPSRFASGAVAMATSRRSLFTRIATLAAFRVRPAWCGVLGLVAVSVVMATFTTNPVAAQAPTPALAENPPAIASTPPATPASAPVAANASAPASAPGAVNAVPVQIAARFVEVTDSGARELAASNPFLAGLFASRQSATQPVAPRPGIGLANVDTAPPFSVGARSAEEMNATLVLLDRASGVHTLSAPRVLTFSGQRAVVEIQQPVPLPRAQQTAQAASPEGVGANTVRIALDVLPTVDPDATIDLELASEIVELAAFNRIGKDGSIATERISSAEPSQKAGAGETLKPVFSTRKVTTNVTVWDGQTIVLGGLQEAGGTDEQGKTLEPRQLLIFITAKIEAPQPAPSVVPPVSVAPAAVLPSPARKP